MKIVMTGANGQIGSRLMRMGVEPLSCDVCDAKEIESELHRVKDADVLIHLASHSSIDWCEKNYEDAVSVNVFGTSAICQKAEEILGRGKVILISSDQVFDGQKGNYQENDEPNPVNVYGLTKVSAEGVAHLYDAKIIRISRCFDSKSSDISGYTEQLKKYKEISVPSHIFRSYCHFDFVAEMIYEYAHRFREMPDILHLGGSFSLSFFDFVCMVAQENGRMVELIHPREDEEGYTPRPRRAGLDVSLARSLGFQIYTPLQSIQRMKKEGFLDRLAEDK